MIGVRILLCSVVLLVLVDDSRIRKKRKLSFNKNLVTKRGSGSRRSRNCKWTAVAQEKNWFTANLSTTRGTKHVTDAR